MTDDINVKLEGVERKLRNLALSEELLKNFYLAVNAGTNKVFHSVVSEAVTLDDGWIYTVENALFFIEEIVKNPKRFIKEESVVVPVAKARRTDSKTVRHLSQNTRDVDKIEDDGSVIPKRVLATILDEDVAIYENRFVCALVHRLVSFVEQRYRDITGANAMVDTTKILLDSEFSYGDTNFSVGLQLSAKEPPKDKVLLERNNALLDKVKLIRRRIKVILGTQFMQQLDKVKPVYPPINKTNLIKMNVNYSNCYKLWLFISSYTMLGYSVEVQDKTLPVDGDYFDDLTILSAVAVKNLSDNEIIRRSIYEKIAFDKPKLKNYRVLTRFEYEPIFKKGKDKVADDNVNEYYFEEMKKAFLKAAKPKTSTTLEEKKTLTMVFNRFFNSVTDISDKMYYDVIKSHAPTKLSRKRRTPVEKAQDNYNREQFLYQNYNRLAKLKGEDYAKALRLVSRQLLKVEQLKITLDELKEKQVKKKERALKRKQKLQKIKELPGAIKQKTDEYSDMIKDRAEEKRLELELREQLKKEEKKRERELKMLEYLKNKYE